MSQPLPRASRRTALGGTLAGALGLAGCAVGPGAGGGPAAPVTTTFGSRSDGSPAGPGAAGTTDPDADPDADPDTALVEVVLRQLSTAHHVVRENRRANPALSERLRPIERLHAVHAAELGTLQALTTTVPDAGGRSAVLKRVAGTEQQLERRLVRGSVEARSGALAQLLASMAAAVTQVRTAL